MRASGYAWWIARLRAVFELVDVVRLDHFRGFEAYWEVPGEARHGDRRPLGEGPGRRLLRGAAGVRSASCRSSPRTSG